MNSVLTARAASYHALTINRLPTLRSPLFSFVSRCFIVVQERGGLKFAAFDLTLFLLIVLK
jgi:hypothetical protein